MGTWSKEEIQLLKDNFEMMTNNELAKLLNRTKSAIINKLNELGLKRPEQYHYDKNFFKIIDNEEKAYWLGFFMADGYVWQTDRNNELGCELSVRDRSHLVKFNKCIGGNLNINTRHREGHWCKDFMGKDYDVCSIRLYSKQIVDDIIAHGCVQNKSLVVGMPKIDKVLMRHWLRGYFDGNGTIARPKHLVVTITTASLNLVDAMRDVLLNDYGVYTYKTLSQTHNELYPDVYKIGVSGKENISNFLNLLYKDCTVYLDRKKKLYDNVIASLSSDA